MTHIEAPDGPDWGEVAPCVVRMLYGASCVLLCNHDVDEACDCAPIPDLDRYLYGHGHEKADCPQCVAAYRNSANLLTGILEPA